MRNFDLPRFLGFAQFVSLVMKIVNLLLYMASGILSMAAVALFFVPQKAISDSFAKALPEASTQISLFRGSITISPNMLDASKIKATAIGFIILSLFSVVVITLIVRCVRKILEQVLAKEPFSDKSCNATKNLAFLYLFSGVFFASLANCCNLLVLNVFGLDKIIINSNLVERISTPIFALDGGMLLTGFLILLLAKIFEYGGYLQNEVDQTV